ncbi:TauD/TfdA family dioxygenase [Pigmentiphaga soli]|uniref:TauD/TfdA family dioxygenase n=1 Tax=Pigmentiphaga soli TaxID=1007095 RepID=A0ABP8GUI9_9BURK
MSSLNTDTPAAWVASDLQADKGWIYRLAPDEQAGLLDAVRRARVAGKPLIAYGRADFALDRWLGTLRAAFGQARGGRGLALVKGLPRQGVSAAEFELLTWAIGLHMGVARPQGKASQYLSTVKNAGGDYRTATGRGYSSNAELDFHTDGADVVVLSCYNAARSGGVSMCTSSVTAFRTIEQERPDLAAILLQPLAFSRQGEEAPGEPPFVTYPVFGIEDGLVFGKWVRNRFENAARMPEAPSPTAQQRAAVDFLDEVVRRKPLMFSMTLEPGDVQILNTHVTLHSRTQFEDFEEDERKRLLYRLWLSTPDAPRLPQGWRQPYGSVEPGVVRGGSKGHQYDDACRAFDRRQAEAMGMRLPA